MQSEMLLNQKNKQLNFLKSEFLKVDSSWIQKLENEFAKDYMLSLQKFLNEELRNKVVYPEVQNIFKALKETAFSNVKIVILGQDPYHGQGQAHGLSFSVLENIKQPPSLRNIFKELENDMLGDFKTPIHGNLQIWAKQGVLLLNNTLTVEAGKPGSHQKKGWEKFTDKILKELNEDKREKVFILWGASAQKKGEFLDDKKHLVLKSVHPSPLSSYRGFFGSRPFSQANKFLKQSGQNPVKWSL